MVTIYCDKGIEKLKKKKDRLVDKFIAEAEAINAQIRYLKSLKEHSEV